MSTWTPLGMESVHGGKYVWSFEHDATWQPRDGSAALWAPEVHFLRGTFFLPYCIGRAGTPGLGTGLLRSTSGRAEGPYVDVKPSGPLTNQIDASLHAAADGSVFFLHQNGLAW